MNVLLLGNGFDINHCLPTKYVNFLHTVTYLGKLKGKYPESVGDVFGAAELQSVDKDIATSYLKYAAYYYEVKIEAETTEQF